MTSDIVIAEMCIMLSLEVELPTLLGSGDTGIQIEKPLRYQTNLWAWTFFFSYPILNINLKIILKLSTVPIEKQNQVKKIQKYTISNSKNFIFFGKGVCTKP